MYRILIMSAIAALSGCEEESAEACEDTPFACECFDDKDNPLDLEKGLAEACEVALAHFAHCVDTVPELTAPDCSPGPEARGIAAIEATDMCDGNGLKEVPSGCMSADDLFWLNERIGNRSCEKNCAIATWDEIISAFERWKDQNLQ